MKNIPMFKLLLFLMEELPLPVPIHLLRKVCFPFSPILKRYYSIYAKAYISNTARFYFCLYSKSIFSQCKYFFQIVKMDYTQSLFNANLLLFPSALPFLRIWCLKKRCLKSSFRDKADLW